jgi:proteasome accessory factor B
VTVPEDVDIRAMVDYQDKRLATPRTATVRVRQGTCQGLRHRASATRPGADGWDELEVTFHDPDRLGAWIASLGADVRVLDPPDLRDAVIRRLKGALA